MGAWRLPKSPPGAFGPPGKPPPKRLIVTDGSVYSWFVAEKVVVGLFDEILTASKVSITGGDDE